MMDSFNVSNQIPTSNFTMTKSPRINVSLLTWSILFVYAYYIGLLVYLVDYLPLHEVIPVDSKEPKYKLSIMIFTSSTGQLPLRLHPAMCNDFRVVYFIWGFLCCYIYFLRLIVKIISFWHIIFIKTIKKA